MGKKVVFIMGTGHCGSTLLDLILGSHSSAFSLGEIHRLTGHSYLKSPCNICEDRCKIWTPDTAKHLNSIYPTLNKFERALRKFKIREGFSTPFYKELFKLTNKEVLIDSSKKPGWIVNNARDLKSSGIDVFLIYLSRNGRAVINSYFRKYPQRGLNTIAEDWVKKIAYINKTYNKWDAEKVCISYDRLSKQPYKTIKNICEEVGIKFESNMMKFWEHDHHPVNGNAGTKSLVLKFKQSNKNKVISMDKKKYYSNHDLGIRYDDRWKRELSSEKLNKIESIIGHLNHDIEEA